MMKPSGSGLTNRLNQLLTNIKFECMPTTFIGQLLPLLSHA